MPLAEPATIAEPLRETPLAALHRAAGARMVPFAGYAMPVQYPTGILAEHAWTREHAGLFDVSHMGPAFLSLTRPTGDAGADHAAVAAIVESLTSADVRGLPAGAMRYTLLLNEQGGILDDLMVGRLPADRSGRLYVVVNAATKESDFARIAAAALGAAAIDPGPFGLLALQDLEGGFGRVDGGDHSAILLEDLRHHVEHVRRVVDNEHPHTVEDSAHVSSDIRRNCRKDCRMLAAKGAAAVAARLQKVTSDRGL